MRLRRAYYELLSHVYDRVIALHSKDGNAGLRDFLIERVGVEAGSRVLDLCTGTGAVALRAQRAAGPRGLIVGVDFSEGMIRKAEEKVRAKGHDGIALTVGDAGLLPFASASFDVVTCSHAMYELTPAARDRALGEIRRVLRPGGRFAMMEHCEPHRPLLRFLYNVRLSALGCSANREFARDEVPCLRRFFREVRREVSSTGGSKLVLGVKDESIDAVARTAVSPTNAS